MYFHLFKGLKTIIGPKFIIKSLVFTYTNIINNKFNNNNSKISKVKLDDFENSFIFYNKSQIYSQSPVSLFYLFKFLLL